MVLTVKRRRIIAGIVCALCCALLIPAISFILPYLLFAADGSLPRRFNDMAEYRAACVQDANLFELPPEETLGSYTEAEFCFRERHRNDYYTKYRMYYTLKLCYEPEDYTAQKALMKERFSLIESAGPQTGGYEPAFAHHGYAFYAEDVFSYPKHMRFIGFCDGENAVYLIRFFDAGLDTDDGFTQILQKYRLLP